MAVDAFGKVITSFLPYTDVNVWLVFLGVALAFFILSHHTQTAKIPYSVIAFLSSIMTVEGSLTLARLQNIATTNSTYVYNGSNISYIQELPIITPTVESLASPAITTFCQIIAIIMFLNLLYQLAYILIPIEEVMK